MPGRRHGDSGGGDIGFDSFSIACLPSPDKKLSRRGRRPDGLPRNAVMRRPSAAAPGSADLLRMPIRAADDGLTASPGGSRLAPNGLCVVEALVVAVRPADEVT